RGEEGDEVVLVTQARVDAEVVGRVVAVGGRGEDGTEEETRGTELDGVVEPRLQGGQTVADLVTGLRTGPLGAEEAERVEVPEHRVADPVRLSHRAASFHRRLHSRDVR